MDNVILCNTLGANELLKPLHYKINMTPILGQAIEIEIDTHLPKIATWPAVLNFHGINIIPQENNRMLIGATIEPGIKPNTTCIDEMLSIKNLPKDWIKESTITKKWSGIRTKPTDKPAPILEKLEPGLIIATCHYRNGVLLTPATAEFISNSINNHLKL